MKRSDFQKQLGEQVEAKLEDDGVERHVLISAMDPKPGMVSALNVRLLEGGNTLAHERKDAAHMVQFPKPVKMTRMLGGLQARHIATTLDNFKVGDDS